MKHHFHMNLTWPGGRNNVGTLEAEKLKVNVSIPEEMDGPGVGTNPDEMLLGASATCYMISLGAMLERANIDAKLAVASEGIVDVTNGVFTYEAIHHHVTIQLEEPSKQAMQMSEKLAYKAEETCMISKAMKGNVDLRVSVEFL